MKLPNPPPRNARLTKKFAYEVLAVMRELEYKLFVSRVLERPSIGIEWEWRCDIRDRMCSIRAHLHQWKDNEKRKAQKHKKEKPMSRSNHDKPFYVDVGTSIVAIRCTSNHDVIVKYDYGIHPPVLQLAKEVCDRMNKEVEIGKPRRNCDVGDADEQFARFKKWCEGEFYKRPMNALTGEPCRSCPCYAVSANGVDGCNYLRWSQMTYEEGGAV